MDKTKIKIVLFAVLIFFSSCFPYRRTASKGNRKPYIIFYVDVSVNQYFFKPQKFKNKNLKEFLTIDFTFRDTLKPQSLAIVNYSLFSFNPISNIDSIILFSDGRSYQLRQCKRLFIRKAHKRYEIRYSCRLSYKSILEYFDGKYYKVEVIINGKRIDFEPTKRTLKNYAIFYNDVISLIKLNSRQ